MKTQQVIILGAGVTGLAAGIRTGYPIYEANHFPGGLCYSYQKKGYRFEFGGGRWLFGGDRLTFNFINSLSPLKTYQRNSAVFFPENDYYIPYPLQNHLSFLPPGLAEKAQLEIKQNVSKTFSPNTTLAHWLEKNFGRTLCRLFFFPFHQAYTADLYTKIAPQDEFKSPTQAAKGYNATFAYPQNGLGDLIEKMAKKCQINYQQKVSKIDLKQKEVLFENGTCLKYKKIISSLPLNKMIQLTKIKLGEPPPPYTSVIILNIGAKKGRECPSYYWLYLPKTKSGFYRVGFYSNIDSHFLTPPRENHVSLYVDTAFKGGNRPTDKSLNQLVNNILEELQDWQFIEQPEVVDPNWIEVAYTWSWPNSKWRERALALLEKNNIFQVGRYGRWRFQGILDSIREGLYLKKV